MTSKAQQISQSVRAQFGIQREQDMVFWNLTSPQTVQVLIALSTPVRNSLEHAVDLGKIQIELQKEQLIIFTTRYDTIAKQLLKVIPIINTVVAPIEKVFNIIPVDTVLGEILKTENELGVNKDDINKVVSQVIDDLTGSSQVVIHSDVVQQLQTLGFNAIDFFNGIKTFKDIKDKVEDLIFRASRATVFSANASSGLIYLENQMKKLQIYKYIIGVINSL